MEKSRLKMTKNMRFRQAEFMASTLRFRTMCTATLGDGNDVENRDLIESGSCPVGTVVRRNIVSFILTFVIVLSDVSSLIFHSCLVRLRHGIMSNEDILLLKRLTEDSIQPWKKSETLEIRMSYCVSGLSAWK